MKSFIIAIGTLLLSYPLIAQTNFPATQTSPVTGAPVIGPANRAPIPPTINNNTNPVNGIGFENTGVNSNMGTGIGFGTGTATGTGTGTGTTVQPFPGVGQPAGGIMNPTGVGTGWQGI